MTVATIDGRVLRRMREEAGISMDQIAQRLEMHLPAVSLIERGFRRMPEDFEARYRQALEEIATERLKAARGQTVGA